MLNSILPQILLVVETIVIETNAVLSWIYLSVASEFLRFGSLSGEQAYLFSRL